MIEKFEVFIPSTDISYRIKGAINDFDRDDSDYVEIFNSPIKSIRWQYNGNCIQINNSEGKIFGYVSPDWKYVLASHIKTRIIEKPKNAVVYNADGTVHLYLDPEKILVHHPLERHNFLRENMGFYSVKWMKNSKDVIVLAVEIVYAGGYFSETWEVDPKTGEFGELLYKEREK
jgi:hypothetical protein